MKHYIKVAYDTLVGLDFALDHDDRQLRTDRWIFTHANAPDQRLTLNFRMSQAAVSKIMRHAEVIVGLAQTETDPEERAKREVKAKRRAKSEREKQIAAAEKRADERGQQIEAANRRRYAVRQSRGALTQDDRVSVMERIRGDWIDPLRIVDELCISESAVREAINSGALDAYMCSGRKIRCKVREVRAWVAAGCPDDGRATA